MNHTPADDVPNTTAEWPSSSDDLRNPQLTPDTFEPIIDVSHTPTGLDLTDPLAAELLVTSNTAADLLDRRVELMQAIRDRAAQQQAPLAALSTAQSIPGDAVAEAPAGRRSGVQLFLLVIGIVLISVAALVFLSTAYILLIPAARSILLAALALLLLGTAWLVSRRQLHATANGLTWLAIVIATTTIFYAVNAEIFAADRLTPGAQTGIGFAVVGLVAFGHHLLTTIRAGSAAAAGLIPLSVLITTTSLASQVKEMEYTSLPFWMGAMLTGLMCLLYQFVPHRIERLIVLGIGAVSLFFAGQSALANLTDTPGFAALIIHLTTGILSLLYLASATLGKRNRGIVARSVSQLSFAGFAIVLTLAPLVTINQSFELLNIWLWPTLSGLIGILFLLAHRYSSTRTAWGRLKTGSVVAAIIAFVIAGTAILPALLVTLWGILTLTFAFNHSTVGDASGYPIPGTIQYTALVALLLLTVIALGASFLLNRRFMPFVAVLASITLLGAPTLLGTPAMSAICTVITSAALVICCCFLAKTGKTAGLPRWATPVLHAVTSLSLIMSYFTTLMTSFWVILSLIVLLLAAVYRIVALRNSHPLQATLTSTVALLGLFAVFWRVPSWLTGDLAPWSVETVVFTVASAALAVVVLFLVTLADTAPLATIERYTLFAVAAAVLTVELGKLLTAQNGNGVWWVILALLGVSLLAPIRQSLSPEDAGVHETATGRRILLSFIGSLGVYGLLTNAVTGQADPPDMISVITAGGLLWAGSIRMSQLPAYRSWPALGPGLALLLLPTLFISLGDDSLWRHVTLGIVALGIVGVGVAFRLQAPILVAGGVLLIHALVQTSPLLVEIYRAAWWLWLALGGAALILIAAYYERNLRFVKSAVRNFRQLR